METISVKVEESGRVLIPAGIRRKMNLGEGSELLIKTSASGVLLSTRDQALVRIRERLRKYIPAGSRLSTDLLRERRREAARENSK